MKNRITISLSMFVDLKVEDDADIKEVIAGLNCECFDTTGTAEVVGVDITDRNLVVENEDEPDIE